MRYEKACGTIIIKDNKVLVIRQKEGHLSFPKGHVEENETEVETALRETKEETNLDVIIDETKRFINKYTIRDEIDKEVIFFLAKPLSEEIIIQESEVSSFHWIDINDLINHLEFDNSKILWNEVLKELNK